MFIRNLDRKLRLLVTTFSLLGLLAMTGLSAFHGSTADAAAPMRVTEAFYGSPYTPPGQLRNTFSASSDNWMYMESGWRNVSGNHVANFNVYSPDGQLYQVLSTPFTGSGGREEVDAGVDMPVAGTWMARMPGIWRVDVTLDGNPRVVATKQFTLTW